MDADQFHRINKALGDPTRFDILERLAACDEMPCANLAEQMPVSQATISHHLKELHSAGLVEVRREAKFGFYKLKRNVWKEYLAEMTRRLNPSPKNRIS